MPKLAETQRLLWRLITAPEGVDKALAAADASGDATRAALFATVRSRGGLDAAQRLDVYANMYFFRLLDVLKDDYPATLALLGDASFHNLVTDYVLQHPPTHFSLGEAGRRLPDFLAAHQILAAHPCAAALARFEWALKEAFVAADAVSLTAADLAALPPEAWAELRFELHPSLQVVTAEWPVHEVRVAIDGGAAAAEPDRRRVQLVVWRQDLTVRHREIIPVEAIALGLIRTGASFAEVCEAAGTVAGAEDAAGEVAPLLGRWVGAGWFSGVFTRS